MTEEQERAAFEAWAVDEGYEVERFDGVYTRVDTCDCWYAWKAALSQPAGEPVAWRCRSWGVDDWAYFDHDDKPETVPPAQLEPLYASQPASPAPEDAPNLAANWIEDLRMSDERERAAFEADAEPYGFDLRRTKMNLSGEPWSDYGDKETGHRWGGWLAARAALSQPASEPVGVVLTRMSPSTGETKTAPELYPAFADLPARTLLYAAQPACPAPEAPTVEQAISTLVTALAASKGWMRDYADSVVRDAIDRRAPEAQPLREALQQISLYRAHNGDTWPADIAKAALMNLNRAAPAAPNEGLSQRNPSPAEQSIALYRREPKPYAMTTAERVAWVRGHSAGWDAAQPGTAIEAIRDVLGDHLCSDGPSAEAALKRVRGILTANGAEAWKDAPREGDWVADAGGETK